MVTHLLDGNDSASWFSAPIVNLLNQISPGSSRPCSATGAGCPPARTPAPDSQPSRERRKPEHIRLERLSVEDLEAESGAVLPTKEVLSVPLLDLNADINLALDLAAPIDLAVAGNVERRLPINAAVSANALSAALDRARQAAARASRSTSSSRATRSRTATRRRRSTRPAAMTVPRRRGRRVMTPAGRRTRPAGRRRPRRRARAARPRSRPGRRRADTAQPRSPTRSAGGRDAAARGRLRAAPPTAAHGRRASLSPRQRLSRRRGRRSARSRRRLLLSRPTRPRPADAPSPPAA